MATTIKNQEPIFVQIDNERIELKGEQLEMYLQDLESRTKEQAILEAIALEKDKARESALRKLAEIAGLTEKELASIL